LFRFLLRKGTHLLLLSGVCLFACSQSAEDLEKQHLEQAWAEQSQPVSTNHSPESTEDLNPVQTTIPLADVPMSIMFDFENLSPLMQGYFEEASSVSTLTEGLRRDSQPLNAPVIVRIRWSDMDLNRGKGEIAVVYDRPVTSFTQLQPVANVLLKYRNHVGGSFDMRLLSFSMKIEGQGVAGCGIPLLNKSGLKYGLLSPCVEIGDQKLCVEKNGRISPEMRRALDLCFIE